MNVEVIEGDKTATRGDNTISTEVGPLNSNLFEAHDGQYSSMIDIESSLLSRDGVAMHINRNNRKMTALRGLSRSLALRIPMRNRMDHHHYHRIRSASCTRIDTSGAIVPLRGLGKNRARAVVVNKDRSKALTTTTQIVPLRGLGKNRARALRAKKDGSKAPTMTTRSQLPALVPLRGLGKNQARAVRAKKERSKAPTRTQLPALRGLRKTRKSTSFPPRRYSYVGNSRLAVFRGLRKNRTFHLQQRRESVEGLQHEQANHDDTQDIQRDQTDTNNDIGLEMIEQRVQQVFFQVDDDVESGLVHARPVSDPPWAIATPCDMPFDVAARSKSTRIQFRTISFMCLVLTMVAGILVWLYSFTHPNFSGNHVKTQQYMRTKQTIIDAFGEDYFDNPEKEKALHWIVHDDPLNASEEEGSHHPTNLIQRFSLVAFYFQTSSQPGAWSYCNPPVNKQSDTCSYNYRISVHGYRYKENKSFGTRWLSAKHECQWMGVLCKKETRTVKELSIIANNVTGLIPADELSKLTHLEVLKLQGNDLMGSLPAKIFKGCKLRSIDLSSNQLSGKIPQKVFLNPTLTWLKLNHNRLAGSIPSEIGHFPGEYLSFAKNQLTGPIPEEIHRATNMRMLFLDGNILSGSIPEQIYRATTLDTLYLDSNLLTGTLSSRLGSLTRLTDLGIGGDSMSGSIPSDVGLLSQLTSLTMEMSRLIGVIPEELYKNSKLTHLRLGRNKLSGTISTRIGILTNLRQLRIADNKFHGTVPTEISQLTNLQSLQVNGNHNLTGSIPDKFCSQLYQKTAFYQTSNRANIIADCAPRVSTGLPAAVSCPKGCCSRCCDVDTGICSEP